MSYGVSHTCSVVAPILPAEEAAAVPEGIAAIYYLRLAFNIARWDDLAIRSASRDPQALLYGVVFSMISAAIVFLVTALPGMLARQGATAGTIFSGLLLGLLFVWVYMGAIAFIVSPRSGNQRLLPRAALHSAAVAAWAAWGIGWLPTNCPIFKHLDLP
jgi:ABC-type Na+ efflux pump permease subunit